MTTGYQIDNQNAVYYITFQVVDWIDVFARQRYRDIVIDSFKYCQKEKGLELFAFVIMSNHIHLMARSKINDLSGTIRDLKKYTSKQIVKSIQTETESRREWILNLFAQAAARQNKKGIYQLWTHENHAVEIYSQKFIEQKVNYIHENPVRNGLVQKPEEYVYASAKYYAGESCVLDVTPVTFLWKTA